MKDTFDRTWLNLLGFLSAGTKKHPIRHETTTDLGPNDQIFLKFQKDSKGNPLFVYKIDVHPRPTADNPAHAQIEPSPDYASKGTFRKVAEKLAWLATERVKNQGWEIEPCELRYETS